MSQNHVRGLVKFIFKKVCHITHLQLHYFTYTLFHTKQLFILLVQNEGVYIEELTVRFVIRSS